MRAPTRPKVAGALCGLVLVVTGCAGTSQSGLSELRVCTGDSFDAGAGECSKDERPDALVSSGVVCSIAFAERQDGDYAVDLSFEGERVNSAEGPVDRDSGTLYVGVTTAQELLPPGSWHCKLAIGEESLATDFRTGGTSSAVPITALICLTSKARGGECPSEANRESFTRPPSVTCSSLMLNPAGERVRITVSRNGREIHRYTTPETADDVMVASATVDPKLLKLGEDTLPAGDYACRFAVGRTSPWTVRFTVRR